MAHFAKLDENNMVTEVIVISNNDILDENGNESEELGIQFCRNLYNEPDAKWIQTSYNSKFRRVYAGIGAYYDPEKDLFYHPDELIPPYPSWTFNEEEFKWEPPVPMPTDHSPNIYYWDEINLSWNLPPSGKPEQPYPSWIWDEYFYEWKAPKLFEELLPEEISQGYDIIWDEDTTSWKKVIQNN